jgi:hypothetical protein
MVNLVKTENHKQTECRSSIMHRQVALLESGAIALRATSCSTHSMKIPVKGDYYEDSQQHKQSDDHSNESLF